MTDLSKRQEVVGRLAPSPTGALHLGNARSFLLAWLSARKQKGRVILRIEDIDSPRVKPWAKQATIDDLAWLGLDWDSGPAESPGLGGSGVADIPLVQTQRLERYRELLEQLVASDRVYPCTCSRSDIANAQSAPHHEGGRQATSVARPAMDGQVYPGTCRNKTVVKSELPTKFVWRWKFATGERTWMDQLLGRVSLCPSEQLGDFVIAKSDFLPAYQLAVVADDHDMGVTEVVRGDDLVYSTFRQMAIQEQFEWIAPKYFHVPLILGDDGRRLAKRHGDTRLSYFREQGVSPRAIVGFLAWTLKLLPEPESCSPRDLLETFDWSRIPKEPTEFSLSRDFKKLKFLG